MKTSEKDNEKYFLAFFSSVVLTALLLGIIEHDYGYLLREKYFPRGGFIAYWKQAWIAASIMSSIVGFFIYRAAVDQERKREAVLALVLGTVMMWILAGSMIGVAFSLYFTYCFAGYVWLRKFRNADW